MPPVIKSGRRKGHPDRSWYAQDNCLREEAEQSESTERVLWEHSRSTKRAIRALKHFFTRALLHPSWLKVMGWVAHCIIMTAPVPWFGVLGTGLVNFGSNIKGPLYLNFVLYSFLDNLINKFLTNKSL